jgi:chemotaxis protein MotA
MNLINLASIFFAIVIMVAAMLFGNENPKKLLDPHGALIVGLGTVACVGVAFKITRALSMVKIFFQGLFKTRVPENKTIIVKLMEFAEAYRSNSPELEKMIEACDDHFMKECLQAMMDKVLDDKKLFRVLNERVNTMYERYADEAKMFISCGKFPPAMGLMGAVLGMIALLGSLGKPAAEKTIGPAMSVALVATLYGIALANLFIIPIGENLTELAKKLRLKNSIIVEGIKHISAKANPIVLAEELNSFLLPSERVDWKTLKK